MLKTILVSLSFGLSLLTFAAYAQNAREEADSLRLKRSAQPVKEKNFSDAEALYDEILPTNVPGEEAKNAGTWLQAIDKKLRYTAFAHSLSKTLPKFNAKPFFHGPVAETHAAKTSSAFPRVEFTLLGGHTITREGTPRIRSAETGLRFVELAVEPRRNLRFWVQYDNGLSLDNLSLARSNVIAPTYTVGGLVAYQNRYLTKFAYGRRSLPGRVRQNIFDIEQVFFLPKGNAFKAGAIIAPRSDNRAEYVIHSGFDVPVAERFRLQPHVFFSRSGIAGEKQVRGLLAAEYAFRNDVKLNGGVALGRESRPFPGDRTITDTYFKISAPLAKYLRPQFQIRHERAGSTSVTVLTFGFTVSNKELR